jgi:hypothetical protein
MNTAAIAASRVRGSHQLDDTEPGEPRSPAKKASALFADSSERNT